MKQAKEEEKARRLKAKRDYHMHFGVGYEVPYLDALHYKPEPMEPEPLLGTYEHAFYESDDTEYESIHRLARGTMELSVKEWSDELAIHGQYTVDTRKNNFTKDKYDYEPVS